MKTIMRAVVLVGLVTLLVCPGLSAETRLADSACPCYESIKDLEDAYYATEDTSFKTLIDTAFANMQELPPEYPDGNPWIDGSFPDLVQFLIDWCEFLPTISGSHDTGFEYIGKFVWFYYHNQYGVDFVQESPGREIMQDFSRQRGAFMDSEASAVVVENWLENSRAEREDYELPDPSAPDGGFKSFNEYFARTLKDQDESRPQTMPDRDYVITAPTDAVMNSIPQVIVDENTLIPTKGIEALRIGDLLGGSKYAAGFIGGTALSCVLMPGAYHHYHASVGGHVVEAGIIEDAYYGYDDFPTWAPIGGNIGYYGSNFNQFANFRRGYFIIDTGTYGHVALIAVGLNTISSIVFEDQFADVTEPVPVARGDRLGHFEYGGSLVILVFEPGRYTSDAIEVRLGNQIGTFDTSEPSSQ